MTDCYKILKIGRIMAALILAVAASGCGTFGGKKSSPLTVGLKANGFEQKETTITLLGETNSPAARMPITAKKEFWEALGQAYAIESFKWRDFYDIELKAKDKLAHLYVRDDNSCALFLRDLPADHPDFAKQDPRLYFVAPGIRSIILAEIMKPPLKKAGK